MTFDIWNIKVFLLFLYVSFKFDYTKFMYCIILLLYYLAGYPIIWLDIFGIIS